MPEFELNEADPNFRQRSTDVFACLEGLANDHEAFLRRSTAEREEVKKTWRQPKPAAEFLEKASGSNATPQEVKETPEFAVPRVPPRHSRRGGGRGGWRGRRGPPPDHVRHPERWTSYSLADVEEVTDAQNAAVAFDFLSELRKRREAAERETAGDEEEEGGRILFRPKRARKERDGGKEERGAEKGARQHCRSLAVEEDEEDEEEEGRALCRPKRAEEEEEEEEEGRALCRPKRAEEEEEEAGERTSRQRGAALAAKAEGKEEVPSAAAVVFRKSGHGSRRRAIRARLSDEEEEDTG